LFVARSFWLRHFYFESKIDLRMNNDYQLSDNLILIVVNESKRFGSYTGEILKAEGYNAFQIEPLTAINLNLLNRFDIVILTETELLPDQAGLFRRFVLNGGHLIAFRPDKPLGDILGLSDAGSVIEEGYLKVKTDLPLGEGITSQTMQFHGTADGYNLEGATPIAMLFMDRVTPTRFPAVVSHEFGHGQAMAFTYNLPESLVYTRQGNPDWANQERDGIIGIRAAEMFLGWNDPALTHLNQADEQIHLLSNMIEGMCTNQKPLPRLWYFPGYSQCLILLTDDGEDSTENDFDAHFTDIESKGALMTLYLKGTSVQPESVSRWVAKGHEIASHFDDTAEAENSTEERMRAVVNAAVQSHLATYGLNPKTVRNHWIVWVGWSEQAEIEASCGIGLDCNYYHYDQGSNHGHYLGQVGGFTGSGLPMKFADRNGHVLPIYQVVTQLPDEQWLDEGFYNNFKILFDRSLNMGQLNFICINNHTYLWQLWSKKHVLKMLEDANQRQVPVWTADRTLDFLTARDAARFEEISWSNNNLSFTFVAPISEPGLTLLLPKWVNNLVLSTVEMDGKSLVWKEFNVKGRPSVLVNAGGGGSFRVQAWYSIKNDTVVG
jgi:hypothetical protein